MRSVNEQIQVAARGFGSHDLNALCECAGNRCIRTFSISMAEYDAVRAHGRRFVVIPRHHDPDGERVIAENDRFVVVEKIGEAGAVAEDLDPRRRPPPAPRSGRPR
jgi:hypothetical protein